MLVADKLANGEEPIESRLCAPHNRYRDGAPPPGIFWLFAIGEPLSATSIASIFAPPVRSDRFAVRNHNLNHGAIKPTMAFSL